LQEIYFVLVLLAFAILLPTLNWWQSRSIARGVAAKVEEVADEQNVVLEEIHLLVNSRLSEALKTIEDLKGLLVLALSADDPRVKKAIAKNS
jgi:hypothetical protein